MKQPSTGEILLASLDRAFDTFGQNVSIVVYFELKKSFNLTREEIPSRPDLLVATIEKLFGVGAETVKRIIGRELEANTGLKNLSSHDLLTALRTVSEQNPKQRTR